LAAPPRFTWIAALPPNIDRHFTKTDFAHRKSMNSIPPGLGPSPLALLIALMVLVLAPAAFLTALILSFRPKLQVERILFVCAFTLSSTLFSICFLYRAGQPAQSLTQFVVLAFFCR
jgi:phosphoglycerol transferase MdoB-like AlkP superfamily enzyme